MTRIKQATLEAEARRAIERLGAPEQWTARDPRRFEVEAAVEIALLTRDRRRLRRALQRYRAYVWRTDEVS